MIKFISKILIFAIILMFIFGGFNYVFKDFNHFEKAIEEYAPEKGNVELAVFGSSHAYHSYDVRRIEIDLNLNCFNFGGAAQRLETTEVVLNKIINENKLKLIIVDIFSMSIDGLNSEGGKQLQLQTLDHLPISFTKIKQTNKIFGTDYLPYALSPFLRDHSKWDTIDGLRVSRDYRLISSNDFYKGFRAVSITFGDKTWKEFYDKFSSKGDIKFEKLSDEQKLKIDKIIFLAKSNNIPIMFVNAPSYVTDYDRRYSKTTAYIKEYLESKKIPFVDFDLMRTQNLLNKKDFKDPNHLNTLGSTKVTDSLIRYIDANYSLKDLKSEKEFKHNKLYQINHNFKDAKINVNLNNKEIKSIALNQSASNTIELIMESDLKEALPIKLDIGLTKSQLKSLYYKDIMFMKENRYFNWAELSEFNSFSLNGKNYNSVQFYYPFDYIENIKVFTGSNDKNKILDKSNIEL